MIQEQIVNYSDKEVIKGKKSLFLAGPTPRNQETLSWRPKAIEIFNNLNFDGVVYIPEYEVRDGVVDNDKHYIITLYLVDEGQANRLYGGKIPKSLQKKISKNISMGYVKLRD